MNKKNLSLWLLGFVSLLFIFTLTFCSQSNTSEPSTALADSTEETSNEDSTNDNHDSRKNKNSLINNNIDNTIKSSSDEADIHNNIENHIESNQADVNNSVDNTMNSHGGQINNSIGNLIEVEDGNVKNFINNHVNSGENNTIDNSVTNHIDVNIGLNVTNNITNDITATSNGTANEENNNGENGSSDEETPETVWGVDSASLTTNELLACVRANFGDPEVWGRYLGTNEGVSYGLTENETDLLHSNDIQILVIWNHFTDGTGYENGENEATAAVETARELGIPEGVALFANVEPIYPIDSAFIQAWHDVMSESEFSSGIYGIFDPSEELYVAFEEAAIEDPSILDEMYVWTAAPNEGITTEANAPENNPEYPDGALLAGWQYGIDAETCNFDTNLFDGQVLDVLW
ncbi:glycoside hydrolase domain-containing protein [Halalkalibacter alkalisediminis]|uniref:Glycoside hydrolase domain-containing protein n=1 Tax=Halalkalibacter alkalisediminis TaxID=935616 RepID=A0ABV6NNV4_9BACI|nr:glycoside hydrolase domain-containing protein [Halalkalibacter alkalisediminis]